MTGWLITNARLVSEGRVDEHDVRVRRGRIEQIGAGLSVGTGETVFDARGRYLLPGMVDTEVHFREPGPGRRGNMASESRAAVAGGVTSYLDLPGTTPPTTTRHALADKFSRAAGRSTANYSFYIGATTENLGEIGALDPNAACGIKVALVPEADGLQFGEGEPLDRLLQNAPLPIAARCENVGLIETTLARARAQHVRLHLLDVSTAVETTLLDANPLADKAISASVTLPHLYFIDADFNELGHQIKTDPAIGTAEDRSLLRQALKEGRLDIVASDHAPHLMRAKIGPYERVEPGLPSIQHALPVAWSLVAGRTLSPPQLVEKIAHNPARRFDLAERGFIREGYHADLTLIDPHQRTDVDRQPLLAQCAWTPFAGRKLPARVSATWVNGRLVWRDGLLTGLVPGEKLEFERHARA